MTLVVGAAISADTVTAFVQEPLARTIPRAVPDAAYSLIVEAAALAVRAIPGILAAVMALVLIRRPGDGITRCGCCGHVLRGLSEPRCPECGHSL